jgi:hypothetical protein
MSIFYPTNEALKMNMRLLFLRWKSRESKLIGVGFWLWSKDEGAAEFPEEFPFAGVFTGDRLRLFLQSRLYHIAAARSRLRFCRSRTVAPRLPSMEHAFR